MVGLFRIDAALHHYRRYLMAFQDRVASREASNRVRWETYLDRTLLITRSTLLMPT